MASQPVVQSAKTHKASRLMALNPSKKSDMKRGAGRNLARFIRLVARTSKRVEQPTDLHAKLKAEHPLILACWHGQFMMLPLFDPSGVKVQAMVARHGDAEIIGEAMKQFGVELIRGAGAGLRKKDRGGAHALRLAVKSLKDDNTVVMTADVPTGKPRRAGEGIIAIARLSGRPIVPVAAATTRFISLKTWSRLTINMPFSKLALVAGEPIFVPRDANEETLETLRLELEQNLNQAMKNAYDHVGADLTRAMPYNSPDVPPTPPGLALKTYRAATTLLSPVTPLIVRYREGQGKEIADRKNERFGLSKRARPDGPLVWIHAASVGETNAILPLIKAMRTSRPDLKFLLTTVTVTSAEIAARGIGEHAIHQFIPLDTPHFAQRFLKHWLPELAIFTESEIWPNLIIETEQAAIPLVLVNGRMSDRSYRRWRKRIHIAAPLFGRFNIILAQNNRLARFFSQLGGKNVVAVGNLKNDAPPPPVNASALEDLTSNLGDRPFYVCASTHEGEEEVILTAHQKIARRIPNVCTIIAPRHPERGVAVSEICKAFGLSFKLRSLGEPPTADTDVYIADTIGELGTLFKAAPIAYIGGSLIKHGGQNPIEAVKHDAAIVVGPSQENFLDTYQALQSYQALKVVTSADSMAEQICDLFGNPVELQKLQQQGHKAVNASGGAIAQTLEAIMPLLPKRVGLKRAS